MSPQHDDVNRPTRQRSNTTFSPFVWRRGRSDAAPVQTTTPATTPQLPLEALIAALTPPAVPSLACARALANALTSQTPSPELSILSPILARLCSSESPVSLQAAGYDILAAYWTNTGPVTLSTADRLSCLSMFLDTSIPWSQELWEPRFKALVAFIQSGAQTVGVESSLLKVLSSWMEGAFQGLLHLDSISSEERLERQRTMEVYTEFLTVLVGKPEFVSRLSDEDTAKVLKLWGRLIDQALLVPMENISLISPPSSPVVEPQSKAMSPQRILPSHGRHHSSTSLPLAASKHPADVVVDSYLTYLSTRLKALAPTYLKSLLPLLFRTLAFYATPLPRVSLTPISQDLNSIEKKILEMLDTLVTGPYSSSCVVILKRHLFPTQQVTEASIQTSLGALRTLRSSIRRFLVGRLARAHITRANSIAYSPAGVPTHLYLDPGLMELAWGKDDAASWEPIRFRAVLAKAAKAWVEKDEGMHGNVLCAPKEAVLNEMAAILKDMLQAFAERGEGEDIDDEEVAAVGDILHELVAYVRSLKSPDGGALFISLAHAEGPSPFLNAVSILLAQDLTSTPLFPVLPSILLSVAEHLLDHDVAHVLSVISERQCLSPTSPMWLDYWGSILKIPSLFTSIRSLTRHIAMDVLQSVWEFVKDIPSYRRPLASLVFDVWKQHPSDAMEDTTVSAIWNLLGDEVVLRILEHHDCGVTTGEGEQQRDPADEILEFLISVASERQEDDDDAASIRTMDITQSPSPLPNATASPVLSRIQSEYPGKEKEQSIPSVMSLLSSLTTGVPSRSQSKPRRTTNELPVEDHPPPLSLEVHAMPKAVGAVVAMVSTFSQLVFTPHALSEYNLSHAINIFRVLVDLLSTAACIRARLTILQFMMRLRVDRDHRLYYASKDYDKDGQIRSLASLINRAEGGNGFEQLVNDHEPRRASVRSPQERDGRRPSRGRGVPTSRVQSRSRSRVPSRMVPVLIKLKARDPLWSIPESLPFSVTDEDITSEGMISYDPAGPRSQMVLPLSMFLAKAMEIIETEKEWEILSYVLCHLPTQLANKHLFCGPKSKVVISHLLAVLCAGISEGTLAHNIERWPEGIIARDAHGLAYHTLTVLISYKRSFKDAQPLHHLVEVFLLGLSGQPSTIKCCLHALSLSAFELQSSMTKYLSRILQKLSQIMSNPAMAVHIIDFLAIVGSHHALHVNFIEEDYKRVFGVALQYLQQHNRPEGSASISWALSQHVRIMSYYIVYLWFLAVELPDRKHHVKYIARQLLLANEGKNEVDEPAEVCFDWLARYTYASADPRPANSMLNDIVMNPTLSKGASEPALSEKTWIVGNAVITIRVLSRRGWVEVVSRRASGLTKFLCRTENVPMVPLGDVDPDLVSVAAGLTMDRDPKDSSELVDVLSDTSHTGGDGPSRPDPITGYVWSGSAPSQRRKEVDIDPGFLPLQLSAYPDNEPVARGRLVVDHTKLPGFFRTLDLMPVIDTHKVGIMYVAPGQRHEAEILRNSHGSPAYNRFLEGLGRLINLRGQVDVYAGGLDPDEDGEYAYAWWDDIGQVLYHTATLMPSGDDEYCTNKKRHIGNDWVRIVWNDSGMPYNFDTLATQFQFVNIVVEPHSRGAIAAFSNNLHENEYFKVIVQRAKGMTEFTPIGDFKLISAENLPLLVRQLSLLADWFVSVWKHTENDTEKNEMTTNWRSRLQAIKRFRTQVTASDSAEVVNIEEGIMGQERHRDFTTSY